MRKYFLLVNLAFPINPSIADISTNVDLVAPTVPKIDKPACAKVELINTERFVTNNPLIAHSRKFTYLITLQKNCTGIIKLSSTYEDPTLRKPQTIQKIFKIEQGALIEGSPSK
jgi:hypothetical protein